MASHFILDRDTSRSLSLANLNETVSVGDTAVSLHTLGGVFLAPQNSEVLTKFSFSGGGGDSGHHIPQILEWGHSSNASKNLPA